LGRDAWRDRRWDRERAWAWHAARPWRVGCNFVPSSAASQLEMWQAASFDPETAARELGFAAGLGFNSIRVFLHDLAWREDPEGFLGRVDSFLGLAAARGIGTMPVLFDGVWNPHPGPGPQPAPRARVHNAGWVQGPGAAILGDPARHPSLRPYVEAVLERFRDDPRIDAWDLFNEPDNPNPAYAREEIPDKAACALALLRSAFTWAREVGPAQPLTVGVWQGDWSDPTRLDEVPRLGLEASDLVSFHCYGDLADLEARVRALRQWDRPLLCTEFMARSLGSTFSPHLGWMKEQGVGAYCWGLVAGRTQTLYPWDSWVKAYREEPDPWFHDVLRPDGTPWDAAEVAAIREVTA